MCIKLKEDVNLFWKIIQRDCLYRAAEWRKICVQELHWHVPNANSVTTILPRIRRLILTEWKPRNIVDSVRDIQIIRKPNNYRSATRTNANVTQVTEWRE